MRNIYRMKVFKQPDGRWWVRGPFGYHLMSFDGWENAIRFAVFYAYTFDMNRAIEHAYAAER